MWRGRSGRGGRFVIMAFLVVGLVFGRGGGGGVGDGDGMGGASGKSEGG